MKLSTKHEPWPGPGVPVDLGDGSSGITGAVAGQIWSAGAIWIEAEHLAAAIAYGWREAQRSGDLVLVER